MHPPAGDDDTMPMQSGAMRKKVRLVTAEEFARFPDDDRRYELVDGVVVEMSPVGGLHGALGVRLAALLEAHVAPRRLGVVMVETGFTLARNPDTVRGPDVSFVCAGRIPPSGVPETFWSGPPDLAVEIRSPGDSLSDLYAKSEAYLTRGVRLVWVLDPQAETVTVFAPGAPVFRLRGEDILDAGDVIEGFRIPVTDLYTRR